tara:strand:+ start:58 stop:1140 length:1083 start_codon:yes stop_codon:yes gene_type:complete
MTKQFITISKEIAESIGLREATLFELLNSNFTNHQQDFNLQDILKEAPFWKKEELLQVLKSLKNKGLISSKDNYSSIELTKPYKEKKSKSPSSFTRKNPSTMPENWEPETQIIEQAADYGIPAGFVLKQLEDFKFLWIEKKELQQSWGLKFLRHVIKAWRKNEIKQNQEKKRIYMHKDWVPDQEAIDILNKADIEDQFIEKYLHEFILYWIEKGDLSDTWNSKFIAYIRRQWARFNEGKSEHTPQEIPADWKPNQEFYDVLKLAKIDQNFANDLIPEFILYWREEGIKINTWNNKFFQHVKYHQKNITPLKEKQKDIEKRIESSWQINQEVNKKENTFTTSKNKEEIKSRLQDLRLKYKI